MRVWLLLLVLLVLAARPGTAHELRPAYLALQQTAPGVFAVLWTVPARDDLRLALEARLPDGCFPEGEVSRSRAGSAWLDRWTVRCPDGLAGGRIGIDGLQATLTDALVRIAWQGGAVEIARLTPDAPAFTVAGQQGTAEVARTYLILGVDHILSGVDHLLFVLALMLLIRDRWMLFKTITAFTLAHSLTLAGATLGWFRLPPAPVEATIALSIAFVARELILRGNGPPRLSERLPWVVAFAFGLLHGFGFAGALRETGLPQTDVPLALLTFNLGVEAGQILFVGLMLSGLALVRHLRPALAMQAEQAAPWLIGGMAMFWLLSRAAALAG